MESKLVPPELAWGIAAVAVLVTAGLYRHLKANPERMRLRPKFSDQDERIFLATRKIIPAFVSSGFVGLIGAALWAWSTDKFLEQLGTLVLVGCAAAGLGGLLGFLFGVPRTVEARAALAASQGGAEAATQASLGCVDGIPDMHI